MAPLRGGELKKSGSLCRESLFYTMFYLNLPSSRARASYQRGDNAYNSNHNEKNYMCWLWVHRGMRTTRQDMIHAGNSIINTEGQGNHCNNNCTIEKSRVFHQVKFLLSQI